MSAFLMRGGGLIASRRLLAKLFYLLADMLPAAAWLGAGFLDDALSNKTDRELSGALKVSSVLAFDSMWSSDPQPS